MTTIRQITGVTVLAVLGLAACGDDDSSNTTTAATAHLTAVTTTAPGDERPAEVPPEATPVDTPEGRVWVWVDNAMVYGPCKIIEPYKDGRLHELVGQDPPEGLADFGYQCFD